MTCGRVVIVGGGLAGMAAAAALESIGCAPTLLESRRCLGGRAGSFEEPQTHQWLDNCQHVLLGCCTNLLDLYARLGASHLIRFERTIYFRDAIGHRFGLGELRGLPAPLHLAASLAGLRMLSLRMRLDISRAMTAMMRLGEPGRLALGDLPFGQWLDEHQQDPQLLPRFYDPILVSALNEESRRAAASYAIQVFQQSLLENARGYVLGLPACPLEELYRQGPCRDVRRGARVSGIEFAAGRACAVQLQNGQRLDTDAVVLATPFQNVQKWIPPELTARDSRFGGLDQLQSVPILGAHLWFDRPVLRDSHAALISGPLQWLFRKDAAGSAVHGVISAARDWVGRPHDLCLEQFAAQIRQTFAAARNAQLLRGVIVVEKRATFSPLPGVDRLRPPQAPPPGGIANLFLAGDYTQTHWPATMEGAVRSGYLAAQALAAWMGKPRRFLVADLPRQWPARLMQRG